MLGKFAVVIGPILMGGVGLLIRSWGFESHVASRVSITSISLLFIAGGIFLFFVDEGKGREQVKYLS
jgi:UMF1 family MFS transporter